ncbi:MAG: hypothetical protein HN796_06370 [Gemmatimonadetes bacterium]|jgi:hypothetical protein|nr:hypothetical protein [Gemmatimonadota bacterium]MBT7453492.1 hypothetical protein [Gemmatimonadota bacterium]
MTRGSDPDHETSRLYTDFWNALPAQLRTEQQLAGIAAVACGATHSVMERCNFACTSCYLSSAANSTQPAPFNEVKTQLDHLRASLGAGGKCQITSGEVTLLEPAELGRLIAYARQIGLDPMVMTNGQRFLQRPDYLLILVRDFGLEKISFHIDNTQKGRPGWRPGMSEEELNPLRDRFAKLVRDTRQQTGKALHAALTMTVTDDNFQGITDVAKWSLANADAIRILSLQPVAPVGRTKDQLSSDLSLDGTWHRVCDSVGKQLNRDALHYGHPACNITVPIVVINTHGTIDVIEAVRAGRAWDQRIMRRALREFHSVVDLGEGVSVGNARRLTLAVQRDPLALCEAIAYGLYRLMGAYRIVLRMLLATLLRSPISVRPLLLVVHHFMGNDELNTDQGRQRLAACVFKLSVDGQLRSMCEVNATGIREQLTKDALRDRAESPQEPAVVSPG